jgi:hypothetical protein
LGAAKAAHVGVEDFYVEESLRCRRTLSAPVPTVRLETAQESRDTWVVLFGNAGGDARAWRTSSAEELATLLGFENERLAAVTPSELSPPPSPSPELRERLYALLREMQLVRGTVLQPTVQLSYGRNDFSLRAKAGPERVRGGSVPDFQVELGATLRTGDAVIRWRHSLSAFGESTLLAQLAPERDPLADLRVCAEGNQAWPAPYGHLPVLWSPEALASLLEPLTGLVEADRFLAGGEALPLLAGRDGGVELGFTIVDEGAPAEAGGIDQEGNASVATLLVDRDGVSTLATTAGLAALLGRPTTGHGRRHGGDGTPVPVLWRPRVEGRERSAALAESLGNGIAVRRCDVVVNGGEATVDVRDARLLHGGVTGERIERFRLRGPYREIVTSLRAFGEARAVVGRRRRKHGREWTTEWHLPPAASLRLPIPGSVPPGHYW